MNTKKNKSIEQLITQLTGISRVDASHKQICVWCKEPIKGFVDDISRKEYDISGMCQECQDKSFS